MPDAPTLRLQLRDVYQDPIKEKIDIILRNQILSEVKKATVNGAAQNVDINGLSGAPQGHYRIDVDPPSYQYVSRFVNIKASGITTLAITFPIDPNKVKKVNFAAYTELPTGVTGLLERSTAVSAFEGKAGKTLYNALDDIRRAGLLNIVTKCGATPLSNKRTVLSYLTELKELRGDRFFVTVPTDLRDETKHSVSEGLFNPAGQILHHPPEGFIHAGSFKTPDHYGNLQLTFFIKDEQCLADIDIDDAAGLEHVFQVVGNKLSGKPTHPYNIHDLLVGYQHLDPPYRFQV